MKLTTTLGAALVAGLFATAGAAADLTVTIQGIKSASGNIHAVLHDGQKGFPDTRTPVQAQQIKAANGAVTVVFSGVTPGQYAVTAFHDENSDNKLDTHFTGAPKEPVGFSRDALGSFGPPTFKSAAIKVGADGAQISFTLN